MLEVRVRSLVMDRLQPLWRRYVARLLDSDHHGRVPGRLEDVNPDGRVLDTTKRMPDEPADAFVVEPELKSSRFATSSLRRCSARPRVRRPRTCIAVKWPYADAVSHSVSAPTPRPSISMFSNLAPSRQIARR